MSPPCSDSPSLELSKVFPEAVYQGEGLVSKPSCAIGAGRLKPVILNSCGSFSRVMHLCGDGL